MRRKHFLIVVLITIFVCFSGCSADNVEELNSKVNNLQTVIPTITSAQTQEGSDLFSPVEDAVIRSEDVQGSQLIVEKTENTDIEQYNVFNQKMEGTKSPSLFCTDGTTGVTYFVNQEQDWYIYAVKNEEVTMAVELPAMELSVWEGKLYFIINDYGIYELEGMQSGDIYVYTPENGSVELVYAAGKQIDKEYIDFSELTVNEDGIFFRCMVGMEVKEYNGTKYNTLKVEDWYLPFDAGEPVKDELSMTYPGWKEYRIRGGEYLELISRKEGKSKKKEIGIQTKKGAIIGNVFFYQANWELGWINLDTGERQTFPLEKFLTETLNLTEEDKQRSFYKLQDFTVTKEHIWCMAGTKYLVRVNLENGETVCYMVEGERQFLEKLYTDGEQIYGTYVEYNVVGKTSVMVKLLLEKENGLQEFYRVPVVKVEKLIH